MEPLSRSERQFTRSSRGLKCKRIRAQELVLTIELLGARKLEHPKGSEENEEDKESGGAC